MHSVERIEMSTDSIELPKIVRSLKDSNIDRHPIQDAPEQVKESNDGCNPCPNSPLFDAGSEKLGGIEMSLGDRNLIQ